MEPAARTKDPNKIRAGTASQSPENMALRIARKYPDLSRDQQHVIDAILRPNAAHGTNSPSASSRTVSPSTLMIWTRCWPGCGM
jgi:glycine cleavage system protein P-like pyridoxal-binding family